MASISAFRPLPLYRFCKQTGYHRTILPNGLQSHIKHNNELQSVLSSPRKRDDPTKQRQSESKTFDKENSDLEYRLENLKSSLRLAYKSVKKANKWSHLNNKRLYDRKAKQRNFQLRDIVYLYNPARKPGKCFKFHKFWTGPFEVTTKLSDLIYEITSMNHKKQVIHVNWLKKAYNPEIWKPKPKQEIPKKRKDKKAIKPEEQEENEIQIGSLPLLKREQLAEGLEPQTPPNQIPNTPEPTSRRTDTPHSECRDPNYEPPGTPRSRRELRTVRPEPPLTRSQIMPVGFLEITNECQDKHCQEDSKCGEVSE